MAHHLNRIENSGLVEGASAPVSSSHRDGKATPTVDSDKPRGFSAISVAVALLSFAAMIGVRMRRRMQPAIALAGSSGHGIDMSIPLATVSAGNTLDLKSHCPLLRIPEQFLQSSERVLAKDMHAGDINSSFVHWDPLGLGEG